MAKFPEPPGLAALHEIEPVTRTLASGTTLVRIFFAGGDHPGSWNAFRHFGPTASRFDHHLPGPGGEADGSVQSLGILYAAAGPQAFPTALNEMFRTARTVDRSSRSPAATFFRTTAPLVFLDMTGTLPTRIGASTAINTGARPRARRWARQLHDAYRSVQGVRYPSSMHANAPAVALFERSVEAMPDEPDLPRPLMDPRLSLVLESTAISIGYRCR